MPPTPPLSSPSTVLLPLLRLRNTFIAPLSSCRSHQCSPAPTRTSQTPSHRHRRAFTNGARQRTNERRQVLFVGKELGVQRYTDEMAGRVHRVTMFKIADEGQKQKLIEQYKVLGSSHKKDGKPYILSMVVGPAIDDPRSQGYTLVAKTEFASLDDMKYYDDECAAHGALKTFVKQNLDVGGVMSVYFEPQAVAQL